MRRVIISLIIVVLIVVIYGIIDVVARLGAQSAISNQIQNQLPNGNVSVDIHSFPFLLRLGTSGKVPEVSVHVSDAKYGRIYFIKIDAEVHNLKVDKHQLFHGNIKVDSIASGTVSAEISQWQVSRLVGSPIRLRRGEIGDGKLYEPVTFSVTGTTVTATAARLGKVSFSLPQLAVLPCLGTITAGPGVLTSSCQLHTVPPFLQKSFSI